jgi:hypothetical protein
MTAFKGMREDTGNLILKKQSSQTAAQILQVKGRVLISESEPPMAFGRNTASAQDGYQFAVAHLAVLFRSAAGCSMRVSRIWRRTIRHAHKQCLGHVHHVRPYPYNLIIGMSKHHGDTAAILR